MTYSPDKASPAVPSKKDRQTRNVLLGFGLVVFFLGAYGSGMEAEIRKARSVNEQRKLVAQDYRDAQRKLRLRIAAVEQLEARRQVALALDQLDKRNFGTAQDSLKQSVNLLDDAQAMQTSNPDLSNVAQALKSTNLVAASDIGAQRDALSGIAAEMDKAFANSTPSLITESVADDKAHPIKNPTMNDVPVPPDQYKGADYTTGQDYPK